MGTVKSSVPDRLCKMETTITEVSAFRGLCYVSEFYECDMKMNHL
jgi:hypothetical protein